MTWLILFGIAVLIWLVLRGQTTQRSKADDDLPDRKEASQIAQMEKRSQSVSLPEVSTHRATLVIAREVCAVLAAEIGASDARAVAVVTLALEREFGSDVWKVVPPEKLAEWTRRIVQSCRASSFPPAKWLEQFEQSLDRPSQDESGVPVDLISEPSLSRS